MIVCYEGRRLPSLLPSLPPSLPPPSLPLSPSPSDLSHAHTDPVQWSEEQVFQWVQWSARHLALDVNLEPFRCMNGQQLCSLAPKQFEDLAFIKEHGSRLKAFLDKCCLCE